MLDYCLRRPVGGILCTLVLLLTCAAPATAGMVATDRVLHGADAQRQALVEALQRDDIRAQLEQMGVPADNARDRIERLTDTEVAHLYQQVGSLPAGGNLSTVELLLIIILIVLLV